MFLMRFFRIRLQYLIHTWNRKPTILLTCCTQHNISYYIKCSIQCLRLIIPQISHLKSTCQHALYIEETTIHGISSCRHIMNVNISLPDCLKLFHCQKEFLIKLLVQFIKNQAAFSRYQCTVCIAVLFISNIHDRLAFQIHFIKHMDKILLIVPIITVALGNCRVHLFQRSLYNIVHFLNRNLLLPHLLCPFFHKLTNKTKVFL